MNKLFNNGYTIVKVNHSCVSGYNGVENHLSWPLDNYNDVDSLRLQNEAWEKWFSYQDVYELVPEKDYLIRYIDHCKKLRIDVTILQIETPKSNQLAVDLFEVKEVLGFDCITGINLSYLNIDPDYFNTHFGTLSKKLNNNRLFDTLEDTYEFLNIYNSLLGEGENLEHGFNPNPALLSIVDL